MDMEDEDVEGGEEDRLEGVEREGGEIKVGRRWRCEREWSSKGNRRSRWPRRRSRLIPVKVSQ